MSSNVIEVTYDDDFRELFKAEHKAWRMPGFRSVIHLIKWISHLRIVGLDSFGAREREETVGIFLGTMVATEIEDFLRSLDNADRVCLRAYIVGEINSIQKLEVCITVYRESSREGAKVVRTMSYVPWLITKRG